MPFPEQPSSLRVPQTGVIGPLTGAASEEVLGLYQLDTLPDGLDAYLRHLGAVGITASPTVNEWIAVAQTARGDFEYVDLGPDDLGLCMRTGEGLTEGMPADPRDWAEEQGIVHYVPNLSDLEHIVAKDPRYRAAIEMEPDELFTTPGNGGNDIPGRYVNIHHRVRTHLVRALVSGELYDKDYESFTAVIKAEHAYLAAAGTHTRSFKPEEIGAFAPKALRYNSRLTASKAMSEVARAYSDHYGSTDRFVKGPADSESVAVVTLPGIDPDCLPRDIVRYGSDGLIRPREEWRNPKTSGYLYLYPPGKAIDQYLHQAWRLGSLVARGIRGGAARTDVLDLIARQYQYLAVARPFININNSLFMHLVNIPVKLLGYEGMTHGQMDLAAQRLQPEAFTRYFADRAQGLRE